MEETHPYLSKGGKIFLVTDVCRYRIGGRCCDGQGILAIKTISLDKFEFTFNGKEVKDQFGNIYTDSDFIDYLMVGIKKYRDDINRDANAALKYLPGIIQRTQPYNKWHFLKTLDVWDARRQNYLIEEVTLEARYKLPSLFEIGCPKALKRSKVIREQLENIIKDIRSAKITDKKDNWFE